MIIFFIGAIVGIGALVFVAVGIDRAYRYGFKEGVKLLATHGNLMYEAGLREGQQSIQGTLRSCMRCEKAVSECTCPDIDARLEQLRALTVPWCPRCDRYLERCKCQKETRAVN